MESEEPLGDEMPNFDVCGTVFKELFFLIFFFFISFAIMIPKKKSKHYRQYINVGRDIATAKKPITAGPEIKYIKKRSC